MYPRSDEATNTSIHNNRLAVRYSVLFLRVLKALSLGLLRQKSIY